MQAPNLATKIFFESLGSKFYEDNNLEDPIIELATTVLLEGQKFVDVYRFRFVFRVAMSSLSPNLL